MEEVALPDIKVLYKCNMAHGIYNKATSTQVRTQKSIHTQMTKVVLQSNREKTFMSRNGAGSAGYSIHIGGD